jgi:imidazolonepropionase-like amidohydrolase
MLAGIAGRSILLREPQSATIFITHVNLIDGAGESEQADMTIAIRGDRIAAVGKSAMTPAEPDALVIDGSGKYAIPGLWDMHVHISDQRAYLPLLVAKGITAVRDMGGSLDVLQDWRRAIAAGTMQGPHIIASGPFVDGPHPAWPNSIAVDTPDDARTAVRHLKEAGADFVKVYSLLPRPAYFAIADESRRQRIPFAGHVPLSVTAEEASDAGQLTIEHIADLMRCPNPEDLSRRLAVNGTWVVPTLVVLQRAANMAPSRLDTVPAVIRQGWEHALPPVVDPSAFRKALNIVGAMQSHGVRLLAGTDTPAPYVVPGFSLHDELALLVRAGLTPMQALRTATRNPAEATGVLASRGTIEPGKIADLVLLEADPLADIANTTRIATVVLRGQPIPKASLEAMSAGRSRN